MCDHTFVICAYKESAFLEECMASLKAQTVPSELLLATSTPNDYITGLAEKYDIPVFVNHGEAGIGGDWNFALSLAQTPFVTLAHQDDIYEPTYAEAVLSAMRKAKRPLIGFSGYIELRNGEKVYRNKLLRIKKLLLMPIRLFPASRAMRRLSLSLGCAICCPAVTYCTKLIQKSPFRNHFRSDLDWEQWENLSHEKGSFCYVSKPLMCHRIHDGSATTEIIGDSARSREDYEMFRKFWPDRIAKKLAHVYASSEKSNEI